MRKRLPVSQYVALWMMVTIGLFGGPLKANEGLWPIQNLPIEDIRKDLHFSPDSTWVHHIQHACVKVTPKGIPGGGSGAYVSAFGLVITNRHCVVDALSELSTPKKDYVKNGMNAATLDEELPSGLQIHVLERQSSYLIRLPGE